MSRFLREPRDQASSLGRVKAQKKKLEMLVISVNYMCMSGAVLILTATYLFVPYLNIFLHLTLCLFLQK